MAIFRRHGRTRILPALLLLLSALAIPQEARPAMKSATLAVDLPAGRWKATRLKNLPRNAAVEVTVRADAPVDVFFLDQKSYDRFPSVRRPLFRGQVHRKLTFSLKIPAAGHYYLVLDNRAGKQEAATDLLIRAARGSDIEPPDEGMTRDQEKALGKTLARIETELHKLFLFDPFPIRARECGKETAASGPDGVVLCAEFVRRIFETVGSKEKTADVLVFTIFHETGHVLLLQWGYPFYDNEDVADDFAAVMMVLLGQPDRLNAATEFFLSNPASAELTAKAIRGDRHQLSVQRARNIVEWRKDPDRVKRWQTVLVPHMKTSALEILHRSSSPWVNRSLVDQELSRRRHSPR